jgi:hypothetical protein
MSTVDTRVEPLSAELLSTLYDAAVATLSAALRGRGYTDIFIEGALPLRAGARMVGVARTLRFVAFRPDLFAEHGGHDVGVRLLTEHAHRRRQVGRPDEHAVNPVHRGDLGCGIHPGRSLDLEDQRHVTVGVLQVRVHPVPPRGAGQGGPDPARTARRVAHRLHDRARLVGGRDHRHEQILRADVEHLLDRDNVADRHPHDRRDRVRRHRLQLREHRLQAVGGVLHVDEGPVHARPGADLGDQRRARAHPDPGERAGCRGQRVAEGGCQTKRHSITPMGP